MLALFEWRFKLPATLQAGGRLIRSQLLLAALVAALFIAWLIYHYVAQPPWIAHLSPLLRELVGLMEAASALTLLIVSPLLLWRTHKRRAATPLPMAIRDILNLSPSAFEHYVADLFRQKGYRVRMRGRSGDHGVDLEIERGDGRRAIVQCKRYQNAIGPDVVRELFGTMIHERVHHAFLVTTADISPAGREWARNKPMTLIDGPALIKIARQLKRADIDAPGDPF